MNQKGIINIIIILTVVIALVWAVYLSFSYNLYPFARGGPDFSVFSPPPPPSVE